VLLEIHGHHFPGRSWHVDGEPCHNLHVGLQVRRDPDSLVPGDSLAAVWSTQIEVLERGGEVDFRGPAVQGKRGARFAYLTWGDVRPDATFVIVRRAKLMLDDLLVFDPLANPDQAVVARVDLTDDRGGPRCARLSPPALELTLAT
jgi:hypothetical protein